MNTAVSSRPRVLLVVRTIILNEGKLLLIQRSKTDSSDPTKWEIPGGKLDKGQHVMNAMERESIEEVGLYVTLLNHLVFLDSDIDGSTKYKGIPYVRLTCLAKSDSVVVRLSHEHDAFRWVTFEEALTFDLTDFSKKSLLAWEKEIQKYS